MKFTMTLPVCVNVDFTVETEDDDSAYAITRLRSPTEAQVRLALEADDAAESIQAEITKRKENRA